MLIKEIHFVNEIPSRTTRGNKEHFKAFKLVKALILQISVRSLSRNRTRIGIWPFSILLSHKLQLYSDSQYNPHDHNNPYNGLGYLDRFRFEVKL